MKITQYNEMVKILSRDSGKKEIYYYEEKCKFIQKGLCFVKKSLDILLNAIEQINHA